MEIVNSVFSNSKGQDFVVESFLNSDSKNRYYRIRFLDTDYIAIVTKSQIKRGYIKDRYSPSVAGVGYLGNTEASRGCKFYSLWHNMINRCHNTKSSEYKRYGEKGVTVDRRWHSFENFKEDIEKVTGYNEYLFASNEIFLDKDKKQINKELKDRIYSFETCEFLSSEENNFYSGIHYSFEAIDENGEKHTGDNISVFCKEHDLITGQVYNVIAGRRPTHKKWKFKKI